MTFELSGSPSVGALSAMAESMDLPSDDEQGFEPEIPLAVQILDTCTRLGLIFTSKQLQDFFR